MEQLACYYPTKGVTQLDVVAQRWEEFPNMHRALAMESLVSNVLKCSGERQILFGSHIFQALNIINTEPKRIYSGYENQFGQKCSGIRRFEDDIKVIKVFKYGNTTYVLYENLNPVNNNIYDMKILSSYEYVQNKVGYKYSNIFTSNPKDYEGMIIPKGTVYLFTSFYDPENNYNFQYGRNLRTLYKSYAGLTNEDAIVISESAAQAFTHDVIEVKDIKINPKSQILVNLFGGLGKDNNPFKQYFPDINQTVAPDGSYLIIRPIEDVVKGTMAAESITRPLASDNVLQFYPGTVIEDIMIDTNMEYSRLFNYNNQLARYAKMKDDDIYQNVCNEVHDLLEKHNIKPENLSYSINNIIHRVTQEFSNTNFTTSNKNDDDYITLKITLRYRKPVVLGTKITDHYGSKGVVSCILPDHLMPMDSYGRRAEIILNPYGSTNRMNPAQLYEQALNYISDVLTIRAKSMDPIVGFDYLVDYIEMVNEDQAKDYRNAMNTYKMRCDWVEELTSGIDELCLKMEPMNRFGIDDMNAICVKYDIDQTDITGQMTPGIIGDKYYIKLVQDPNHSNSYRGIGIGNANSLPTRVKDDSVIHINTPIRWGTEELANLILNAVSDFNPHKEKKIDELIDALRNVLTADQMILLQGLKLKYNHLNSFTNKKACDMTHHPLDEFKMISNSSIEAREEYIRHAMKGETNYPNIDPKNINNLPLASQAMENYLNIFGASIDKKNPINHVVSREEIFTGLEL